MNSNSKTGDNIYTGTQSTTNDIEWSTNIYVKYTDPNFPTIVIIDQGDWIDIKTAEEIDLKAGDFTCIDLGVAMKLPNGYEAWLAPRSSTFKKYGLLQTNSVGIIDSTYCGNDDIWKMPVYATRDIHIEKGTRLSQFRLMPTMKAIQAMNLAYHFNPKTDIITVNDLGTSNRGGLGSTGI